MLSWPVEPTPSVAAFGRKLDYWLAQARGQAELCLLPEYTAVELGAALAGRSVAGEAEELAAMVAAAPEILAEMRAAARRAGLWVQAGTLPMLAEGRVVNVAPLIAPDGRMAIQRKCMMTRFELESWGVAPGGAPQVFDTPFGRIGISVCYDVEFPKHVRMQAEAGAWLILTPACTDTRAGAARVRIGAQARALENQFYVAVAPTVGVAPHSAALDENHGQAALYGPPDRGFPEDGVVAAGPADAPGWLFVAADPALVARVRAEGAVRNHQDFPRAPMPPCRPATFA
jgi:predicted amidohydrolase